LHTATQFEAKLMSERVREHPAHSMTCAGPMTQGPPDRLLAHDAIESILKDPP
jgi:hypothetical protein